MTNKKERQMKYVAFLGPDRFWDGLDWVYDLMEDSRKSEYDFFLVTAKNKEAVRKLVAERFYDKKLRQGGDEYIIERAFEGFCGLVECEDGELLEQLGPKDGKAAIEFFEKYTWDAFLNGTVHFYDNFEMEDRDKFFAFEKENLKMLYKDSIMSDILIMPISEELLEKTSGGCP